MTLSAYLEVCLSALSHGDLAASRMLAHSHSVFSWTTASSPPSSLKTSAWCSTPGTLRSPRRVLSGTSLGVGTPKLLTGKPAGWCTLVHLLMIIIIKMYSTPIKKSQSEFWGSVLCTTSACWLQFCFLTGSVKHDFTVSGKLWQKYLNWCFTSSLVPHRINEMIGCSNCNQWYLCLCSPENKDTSQRFTDGNKYFYIQHSHYWGRILL